MENVNPNSSSQIDDVKRMFDTYYSDNNSKGNSGSKKPKIDYLKKIFNPREDNEVFRLVARENELPIEEAYFHILEVNDPKRYNGKNKNKKILCPIKNGVKVPQKDANGNPVLDANGKPIMVTPRCRACEERDRILATQDQSIKGKKKDELTPQEKIIWENNGKIFGRAMKYDAKKFHIIKGINRNSPLDGLKFWRFKDNAKKQGVLDKLIPAMNLYDKTYNVYPLHNLNGADLNIVMSDFPMPNVPGKTYRAVSILQFGQPSPLHQDQHVVDQWLNEKITWRDVFKLPNMGRLDQYDYVDRVIRGVDPYWDESDKKNQKWVFPDPNDYALMQKANEKTNQQQNSLEANQQQTPSLEASAVDAINASYQNNVNITNVTPQDAGQFNPQVTNVGQQFVPQPQVQQPQVSQQQVQQQVPNQGMVPQPQNQVHNQGFVPQQQVPQPQVQQPQVNNGGYGQSTSINPAETINQQPQQPQQPQANEDYDIDDLPF